MQRAALSIATILLCLPSMAAAQWDRYAPGQIRDIIEQFDADVRDHPPDRPMWDFSATGLPIRVRATYVGQDRPIYAIRDTLLLRWGVTTNRPAVTTAFSREFLFREDGIDHWLPVQDVLMDDLQSEVQPGDTVTLFVMWVGGYHLDGPVVWLFLVNEFLADAPSG